MKKVEDGPTVGEFYQEQSILGIEQRKTFREFKKIPQRTKPRFHRYQGSTGSRQSDNRYTVRPVAGKFHCMLGTN